MCDPKSGDQILINGTPAEVINTYSVGDLDYLRAYIEDVGVKTVCIDDVDIEAKQDSVSALEPATANQLHPDHEAVSADWFDLRSQALQLQIAHEQGQLLSISNSLVRLEPYQLACVNWVMQKLRQRALIADDVGRLGGVERHGVRGAAGVLHELHLLEALGIGFEEEFAHLVGRTVHRPHHGDGRRHGDEPLVDLAVAGSNSAGNPTRNTMASSTATVFTSMSTACSCWFGVIIWTTSTTGSG